MGSTIEKVQDTLTILSDTISKAKTLYHNSLYDKGSGFMERELEAILQFCSLQLPNKKYLASLFGSDDIYSQIVWQVAMDLIHKMPEGYHVPLRPDRGFQFLTHDDGRITLPISYEEHGSRLEATFGHIDLMKREVVIYIPTLKSIRQACEAELKKNLDERRNRQNERDIRFINHILETYEAIEVGLKPHGFTIRTA